MWEGRRSEKVEGDLSAYQEIAENALAVTGVQWVSVHHVDLERDVLRIMALAPVYSEKVQRLLASVRRVVPSWDPLAVDTSLDVNPVHVRAYRDGESVEASLREVTEGILPHPVVAAIERVTGVRRVLVEPFHIDGELAGSMAFLSVEPLPDSTRRAAHAFVRQAALTLEKERLAERFSDRVESLHQSSHGFIATEERLRKELALHLHGKVQTSLIAAGFILDRCEKMLVEDPEQVLELIGEVKAEVDRLREEEIREVSHLLHPSVIDVAVTPALRSLASRYQDRFTAVVNVDAGVAELDRVGGNQLPADLRLTVYRIVEEALANASQHARPAAVTIALSCVDKALVVQVTDDGVGFDAEQVDTGLGLGGIDYRVQQADGRWEIDSVPDRGTRISAWFPLEG